MTNKTQATFKQRKDAFPYQHPNLHLHLHLHVSMSRWRGARRREGRSRRKCTEFGCICALLHTWLCVGVVECVFLFLLLPRARKRIRVRSRRGRGKGRRRENDGKLCFRQWERWGDRSRQTGNGPDHTSCFTI